MAYVANDGPPSLDATHEWAPATGSAPAAINTKTDPPTFPWIKLKQITGWRAAPEADDNREPRTIGSGEITYPGRLLGRTIVYECEIRARTRESVQLTITSILNGYLDRSGLGTMTVTPFPSPGGVVWQYQARVLSLDADPAWDYNPGRAWPYVWGFALSLRMPSPFFFTPALGGAAYL